MAEITQLVVVGSSAGGIEALSTLVATVPKDFSAPIVIAQHLDPQRPSHLSEILSRRSRLPVQTILDHETLQSGHVYVVPADRHVEIADSHLNLSSDHQGRPKPSINLLFSSAAGVYGDGLIAVILTGTGSDGATGALEVKRHGGTVVIQDPDSAEYPAMPRSLAPTAVDFIAHIEEIGTLLTDLLLGTLDLTRPNEVKSLHAFLQQVHERSGLDFTSYKLPTIQRRLHRRMVATGTTSLSAYRRYLQHHPEEYSRLISSFLIKVTEFFRDHDLYTFLREDVLPRLIAAARQRGNELRLWSAGCATGEEAYSLAILVADLLGDELDQFNVRIFATDLDNDAITFARHGTYPPSAVAGLSPELLDRYFQHIDSDYEVQKRIRSMVIFGQHDLGQRAPFPRIDLILCHNVLIYFTLDLQKRVLHLFAYSLRDNGYLVLGKAEMTSPLPEFFQSVNPLLKIFSRHGERLMLPIGQFKDPAPIHAVAPRLPISTLAQSPAHDNRRQRSSLEKLGGFVFNLPVGVVVVDRRYDIQIINNAAHQLLEIHRPALGEDLLHLAEDVPTKPLRAIIDSALNGATTPPTTGILPVTTPTGDQRYLHVVGYPHLFEDDDGPTASVLLLVSDVTGQMELHQPITAAADEAARARATQEPSDLMALAQQQRGEIEHLTTQVQRLIAVNRELREANHELTATNLDLHQANEAYLVNTEEVQAAAEEVETLNEELQATNEELETLNEELQATVEELNATNDDLEARSGELQDLAREREEQRREADAERARLAAILVSMGDAVLVVAPTGLPMLVNAAYTQLFGDMQALPPFTDEQGRSLPPDAQPRQRAARGETFTSTYTLLAADGWRRWFEANGQPIVMDGLAQGGVVVIRDITDRSLRRLQDEFLARASHELRTPLTSAQMALQLAQKKLKDSTQKVDIQPQLEVALRQVQHLNILVGDLMDVGRLQTGNLQLQHTLCVLQQIVTQAVEAVQLTVPDRQITVTAPEDALRVRGDALRLEQIIFNLLTNAVKYAPQSQHIDLRLRRVIDLAVIEVQDYGAGIAANQLPHLFTRFYRVTQSNDVVRNGLGLGLFITKELVTAHGGTIDVRSESGTGTIFTVTLPLLP